MNQGPDDCRRLGFQFRMLIVLTQEGHKASEEIVIF